jgi:energy-coupling factor transporter transmembrane protein EcfT
MENQEAYFKAKKRVEAKIGFYIHLAVYIVVNILLIIINLATSTGYLWFKWPLIGWGIGVFFHAMGVFVFSGGSVIKEKMIEKEMKKQSLKPSEQNED